MNAFVNRGCQTNSTPQDDDAFVAAALLRRGPQLGLPARTVAVAVRTARGPTQRHRSRRIVLSASSSAMLRSPRYLKGVTSFPVRFSRLTNGLDKFMQSPSLRAVFYVNQGTSNFQALRYPEPAHVHLSHGESEKISMISNQLKGYDYVFTAGQAARERIEQTLYGMSDDRMFDVGRPQLDRPRSVPHEWKEFKSRPPGWRKRCSTPRRGRVTLRRWRTAPSPTTETQIVTSLLEAGYRVIFRPHPRTGVMRHEFEKAVEDVAEIVESDPRGFLDKSPDVSWQLDEADLAVVEMTSVAFDWLVLRKTPGDGPTARTRSRSARRRSVGPVSDGGPGETGTTSSTSSTRPSSRDGSVADLAQFYLGDTAPGCADRSLHPFERTGDRADGPRNIA